jgi:hypothetical protein
MQSEWGGAGWEPVGGCSVGPQLRRRLLVTQAAGQGHEFVSCLLSTSCGQAYRRTPCWVSQGTADTFLGSISRTPTSLSVYSRPVQGV